MTLAHLRMRLGEWMRWLFGLPVAQAPKQDIIDRTQEFARFRDEMRERLERAREQIDRAEEQIDPHPHPHPRPWPWPREGQ